MLLDFNKITVNDNWYVEEQQAPIFTRAYWVLSGEVTYFDSSGFFELKPNRLYLFPTTRGYKMEQNVSQKLYCLFAHLEIAPYSISQPIELDPAEHPMIFGTLCALDSIISLLQGDERKSALQAADQLWGALITWLSLKGMLDEDYKSLKPAIEYISSQFSEDISIEKLSGLCGYHPKYFINVFKSVFGISPYKYIVNYRLKLSCSMLKSGAAVETAASSCGYKEAKSFCRAFKQRYGISPMTYAKGTELLL